jgi:hypothetical protein
MDQIMSAINTRPVSPDVNATFPSNTELQYLHPGDRPGRPSGQSSRTAVTDTPNETKSEQLLQLILDELKHRNESSRSPSPTLSQTAIKDHCTSPPSQSQPNLNLTTSRPELARGASNSSSTSLSPFSPGTEGRFYEKLFIALVTFAAFGGSITFQCIWQTAPTTSENKSLTPQRARTFIALSWLLFTIDLALSSILLAALYVCKNRVSKAGDTWYNWKIVIFRYINLLAALILPLGCIAALVFAALAVSVLSYAVGKTALICVIVLGGIVVLWWFSFVVRYCYRKKREVSLA